MGICCSGGHAERYTFTSQYGGSDFNQIAYSSTPDPVGIQSYLSDSPKYVPFVYDKRLIEQLDQSYSLDTLLFSKEPNYNEMFKMLQLQAQSTTDVMSAPGPNTSTYLKSGELSFDSQNDD